VHNAPSSGTLGYRPALDGVRALAIACVVLSPTIGFPVTGYIGVDVFFVLSGFLITTLLLEEHARRGTVSLGDFYRRRALRLLPALFALLGVFLAVSIAAVLIRGGSLDRALFGVVAGTGYFTNLALAAGPPTEPAMPGELRHLWSLAIEEQFYFVWPVVLLVIFRARLRLALLGLGAILILASIQQIRLYLDGATAERIGYGTDTHGTPILVGCVLAVALATSVHSSKRSRERSRSLSRPVPSRSFSSSRRGASSARGSWSSRSVRHGSFSAPSTPGRSWLECSPWLQWSFWAASRTRCTYGTSRST
jgi:peptidoglycan/LPS O-acetylase OafA/YrhL